jgi:glycosyltransferase involved in cell wall biosynthesis
MTYVSISQTKLGLIRDAWMIRIASKRVKKVVAHLHGNNLGHVLDELGPLASSFVRRAIKKIDTGVVLSEALKGNFRNLPKHIAVVQNGIERDYFRNWDLEQANKQRHERHSFTIVYLSNLIKTKGFSDLIQAVIQLAKEHHDVRLLLAGQIYDRGLFEKLMADVKAAHLEQWIRYLGQVTGNRKKRLLLSGDLMALPTRYPIEGQPISIIEGMAAGMPILSTDQGGIPELIRGNGIVLSEVNPQSIASAIKTMMSDRSLCHHYAQVSRSRFLSTYTLDRSLQTLLSVFNTRPEDDALKKKIVFVINYFYPDPASTGQLLTELCLALQDSFRITVIAAQPGSYAGGEGHAMSIFESSSLEKIRIVRLKLPKLNKQSKISRLKYILMYFVLATVAMLKEKSTDIIYTISTPPVLGGLIGTIGKFLKRTRYVYNIQDFNPEQAEAVSYTKNHLVYSVARGIDNFSCRHADNIVLVGQDMVETLKHRFMEKKMPHYQVINNWTDEHEIVPLSKKEPHVAGFLEEHQLTGKFIVMYSGNLGLYYDLENLIKVTRPFKDFDNIAFVFIGDGAMKSRMQDYVIRENITNVHFLPYQPKNFLKYSLNAADVHLVVNQKGIKGVSVPSKLYGVMAAGKPVLGVLESGSEAERLIRESGCGLVVEPMDYTGVRNLVTAFFNMEQEEREKMGLSGRNYLEQHLTRDLSIRKYKQMLLSL